MAQPNEFLKSKKQPSLLQWMDEWKHLLVSTSFHAHRPSILESSPASSLLLRRFSPLAPLIRSLSVLQSPISVSLFPAAMPDHPQDAPFVDSAHTEDQPLYRPSVFSNNNKCCQDAENLTGLRLRKVSDLSMVTQL